MSSIDLQQITALLAPGVVIDYFCLPTVRLPLWDDKAKASIEKSASHLKKLKQMPN